MFLNGFLNRILRGIVVFAIAIAFLLGNITTPPAFAQESTQPVDGSTLPFPPVPSASVAGQTLQESTMERRVEPNYLSGDPPNILIILLDDVGFGQSTVLGGAVESPTFEKLSKEGLLYDTFHTTSICSPTRASLLTGRNHHRVYSGTIAERAMDWDGYLGIIPKTSGTLPEVLREYGYKTSAFGKWHNSPADQTTAMGPFDRWPTGHGFDYFYGFLAGETSQYEPRLVENTNQIEPPHTLVDDDGTEHPYHLSADLANQAVKWMREHRSYSPDKPFFMYWAPGATHGPHHIFNELADEYKGVFDDGWEAYRESIIRNQQRMGLAPLPADGNAETVVDTPFPDDMDHWSDVADNEKAFQIRLMELYAAFLEDVDRQAGKLIDELDAQGIRDNTLIFYIWGDNGASAEGQHGSISELLAQNQIPNTVEQQLKALRSQFGTIRDPRGFDALGSPKTDNMYNAGWAWAGDAPFSYTKLVASHFGGTRNPMIISWPKEIQIDTESDDPRRNVRSQFHHVNDIAPTIYDILNITPPDELYGFTQDPIDGISMTYTFAQANKTAPTQKQTQYFENNGSRGIYSDGWYACAFGPLEPWITGDPNELKEWDSNEDVWELYYLPDDFKQLNNLADPKYNGQYDETLDDLKELFLQEAEDNLVYPIGGSLWSRIHPEDTLSSPYTSWTFDTTTTRMPEFTAPALGRKSSKVAISVSLNDSDSGVLYALAGAGGGLTLYMEDGTLTYEYNKMLLDRYTASTSTPLPPGDYTITVDTNFVKNSPGLAPADVAIAVEDAGGTTVATAETCVEQTVPNAFSASESFDVGVDLGSPVSTAYAEQAPFAFTGQIHQVNVDLTEGVDALTVCKLQGL